MKMKIQGNKFPVEGKIDTSKIHVVYKLYNVLSLCTEYEFESIWGFEWRGWKMCFVWANDDVLRFEKKKKEAH